MSDQALQATPVSVFMTDDAGDGLDELMNTSRTDLVRVVQTLCSRTRDNLDHAVDLTAQAFPGSVAHLCLLFSESMYLVSSSNLDFHIPIGSETSLHNCYCRWVVITGGSICIPDASSIDFDHSEMDQYAKAYLGVPILSSPVAGHRANRHRIIGALGLRFEHPREFLESELIQLKASARLIEETLELEYLRLDRESVHSDTSLPDVNQRRTDELTTIYDNMPIGLAALDKDFVYRRVNQRFAELHQRRVEDFIGSRIGELNPEIGSQRVPAVEHALKTGKTVTDHEVMLRDERDGTPRYWLESVSPIRLGDGTIVGAQIGSQDITAIRNGERAARENADFLRRVLDALAVHATVCLPDGTIIEANSRLFGHGDGDGNVEHESLVGCQFQDLPLWRNTHRAREIIEDAFSKAADDREAHVEIRCPSESDRSRLIISIQVRALKNHQGQLTHLVVTAADVSDYKRVKLQHHRLATIIESTSDFVATASPDGQMVYLNRAGRKLVNLPEGTEVQDTTIPDYHSKEMADRVIETLLPAAADQGTWTGENTLKSFDGEDIPVSQVIIAHRNAQDQVVYYSTICRDIRLQKSLEEAMRLSENKAVAANQAKSEFLANMSHEIRSPIAAVLGYAEILQRQSTDPKVVNASNVIHRNGEFLLRIVNDILDLSKIEAGKFSIDREPVSPTTLIEDVHSLMHARAAEKNIQFTVRYQSQVPEWIRTDPVRLRQILINLISNAIKFTERGEVSLEVSHEQTDGNALIIRIRDTGIGITEEQMEHLFKPFEQANKEAARIYGGTGLGLSISRRLAKMLNAQIDAASTPGQGSVFTLRLLIDTESSQTLIDPTTFITASPPAQQQKITLSGHLLVVDDRDDIREMISTIIRSAGATVTEVSDGLQAVEAYEASLGSASAIDLIVMDLQMPVMGGLEATRHLRLKGHRIPIIALTAAAMKEDHERCLEAGCDAFMSKPIDQAELLKSIAMLISKPAAEPEPEPGSPQACCCNVLIIEDNRDTASALAMLLEFEGHTVAVAHTAAEGIRSTANLHPDVVITDIGLPDMNGFELVSTLRQQTRFEETQFIALSGAELEPERLRQSGFDHALLKPVTAADLMKLFQSTL